MLTVVSTESLCRSNSQFQCNIKKSEMGGCKNIVITGGNRGIGLELVKQILSRFNPEHLFVTYRDPASSKELLDLAKQNANLHAVALDMRATDKYADFVATVKTTTQDSGVNLLINNAGMFNSDVGNTLPQVDKVDLMYHFEVNTVAPTILTQAFLPLLEKASSRAGSQPLGINRATVLNVTSTMGSIAENTSGGSYAYRISKAALNQVSKTMSIELAKKGILVIPLHPGWVKTDMGGPNGLITSGECVSGILSVLENLNETKAGQFWRFDGKIASW